MFIQSANSFEHLLCAGAKDVPKGLEVSWGKLLCSESSQVEASVPEAADECRRSEHPREA